MDDTEVLTAKLAEMYKLKALPRAGWLRKGISPPESVAAHSWGISLLIMLLTPPELDRLKALEIAAVHDLAESEVGDFTPQDGISAELKHRLESEAIEKMQSGLASGERLSERFKEYQENKTPEARFVHALDKLDMALQALVYQRRRPEADFSEFIDSSLNYYRINRLDAFFPDLYGLLQTVSREASKR
ncbi:HD domain-containing protein [bacterium]|nr:HD domain-containing protein [bacterium]